MTPEREKFMRDLGKAAREKRDEVITEVLKADPRVDHPPYYNQGQIEVIDFIRDQLTRERYEGFLQGCVLQYICRYPHKGEAETDLKKARFYLNELIRVYGRPTTREGS